MREDLCKLRPSLGRFAGVLWPAPGDGPQTASQFTIGGSSISLEHSKHSVLVSVFRLERGIECLLNDNHQKGKMMIMIMETSGSQVDSLVAEGKRKEGGGRKIRDSHRDT